MRLNTKLARVKLENPTVLVSGILGINAFLHRRCELAGAGATTTKSIGPVRREGHPNPTIVELSCNSMLNAVGLSNPGVDEFLAHWDKYAILKKPLIVSVFGSTIEEFKAVAERIAEKRPAMIELNISCPNVKGHGQAFGLYANTAAEVVASVKEVAGRIPVMPKLTPNAPNIAEIGKACEEAGADAIAACNTLGPAMEIDLEAKRPILSNKVGGLSGEALRTVALAKVYQLYEAVEVPILGIGGISTSEDALKMVMAGASAVGVGTAVAYRGVSVFSEIVSGMRNWMEAHGYSGLKELVGVAHG